MTFSDSLRIYEVLDVGMLSCMQLWKHFLYECVREKVHISFLNILRNEYNDIMSTQPM
jgi:hypothetical protein